MFNKWDYKPVASRETGYEEFEEELKSYTPERFENSTEEEQNKIVKRIFEIYRNKNIFPITYYNEQGLFEEVQKCCSRNVEWGDTLDISMNDGQSLCRFLFPNMMSVVVRNEKHNTMLERFYDDVKLMKAIRLCFQLGETPLSINIHRALRMIGGNIVLNFKTMTAKALYERYCPPQGTIYDFSCGFGGRMLGALSSKRNFKYIGVEPCIETFDSLNILGEIIEKATGRENIFKINCIGSEDYVGEKESMDFAFSSPPYFNLEKYSEEDTQCYNKYPDLDSWFEGYVRPTIKNIWDMLKWDRYYAVNIADFKVGSKKVAFVDKWIKLSKELGFTFVERIDMKISTRRGNGHDSEKNEGIYIFAKTKDIKNMKIYKPKKAEQISLF